MEDSIAIPLSEIKKVFSVLECGSTTSVYFKILTFTGCRVCEIENMRPECLEGNVLYWEKGKNQTGWRKAILPHSLVKEIERYRETHNVPQNRLFAAKGHSFRRYFNRDVRPLLGPEWQMIKKSFDRVNKTYKLQLKGLRKTFATLEYLARLNEWDDPIIALECVSKQLGHSTQHMTFYHYIREFETLGIKKGSNPFNLKELAAETQTRLGQFS